MHRQNCSVRSLCLGLLLLVTAAFSQADPVRVERVDYEPAILSSGQPPRYQAVLELHSADELLKVLQRAEAVVNASQANGYPDREPVALILFGDEVRLFEHQRYTENRDLVDLAASLEAFRVVDLKVCSAWLRDHDLEASDLPAFLDAVPYGPDEVKRLHDSGYTFF